jgi:hypothetical protein
MCDFFPYTPPTSAIFPVLAELKPSAFTGQRLHVHDLSWLVMRCDFEDTGASEQARPAVSMMVDILDTTSTPHTKPTRPLTST